MHSLNKAYMQAYVTMSKGIMGGHSSTLFSDWSSECFIISKSLIKSYFVQIALCCRYSQQGWGFEGSDNSLKSIDYIPNYLWALLGTVLNLDNLSQISCICISYIVQSIGIYPKSWPCYFLKRQHFSPCLIFYSCHPQVIWLPLRSSTLNKKTWHLERGKKSLKLEWNDHRVYLDEHSINHFLNKTIPIRSFFSVKGKIKWVPQLHSHIIPFNYTWCSFTDT